MRLQAVLLRQDEPWRGQDRHDSATALPVDGRATGLRGGGAVPGYRGVSAGFSEKRLSIRALGMSFLRDLDPVMFVSSEGGEGVLGPLPAPANSQPEAACSRPKGGV